MRVARFSLALAWLFVCAQVSQAVIISTGSGSGNTTAPIDDPGFAYVGTRGNASAIYLGNGWVLTANHVGAGTTSFGNKSYNMVPNSSVQLFNPTGAGFTPLTDFLMYKIENAPAWPSLLINDSPVEAGWNVTMIGRGRDRSPDLGNWAADWQPSSTPSAYSGYTWANSNSIRWGTNIIENVKLQSSVQTNSLTTFTTRFSNDATATPFEAQAALGDSGGAVFHKDPVSGLWELTGMMVAISSWNGQPASTAMFGNKTYIGDLYVYRDQIAPLITLVGDLDYNGRVDIFDLNLLAANWGSSNARFDLDRNGIVDIFDVQVLARNWTSTQPMPASFSVPEPATMTLCIAALAALYLCRRRLAVRSVKR